MDYGECYSILLDMNPNVRLVALFWFPTRSKKTKIMILGVKREEKELKRIENLIASGKEVLEKQAVLDAGLYSPIYLFDIKYPQTRIVFS